MKQSWWWAWMTKMLLSILQSTESNLMFLVCVIFSHLAYFQCKRLTLTSCLSLWCHQWQPQLCSLLRLNPAQLALILQSTQLLASAFQCLRIGSLRLKCLVASMTKCSKECRVNLLVYSQFLQETLCSARRRNMMKTVSLSTILFKPWKMFLRTKLCLNTSLSILTKTLIW